MKILILAAGYGTRLYPLIKDKPKALLEVNGKPLIGHIIDRIKALSGISELVVVTNDKFSADFSAWSQTVDGLSFPITIVNDGTTTPENRLGSIGDINFVLQHRKMDEDVLVVGSDNLFDFCIDAYIIFAERNKPHASIGLYDIHDRQQAKLYGVAVLDESGKVVSFEEKPSAPRSTLVAMCFYYFPQGSLRLIPRFIKEGHKADKAGDYIRWLTEKDVVYGFKFTGKWYDIGSMESYHEAKRYFR